MYKTLTGNKIEPIPEISSGSENKIPSQPKKAQTQRSEIIERLQKNGNHPLKTSGEYQHPGLTKTKALL
jgi:hypothetical protein